MLNILLVIQIMKKKKISFIHRVAVKLALEVKEKLAWDEQIITWNLSVNLEEIFLLFWV